MLHSPVLLILDALAVFRVTRLITTDTITANLREWLSGRTYGQSRDLQGQRPPIAARPRLAQFIVCPWCVSPYVAIPVVALTRLIPGQWIYIAAVLAFSAVTGLLAEAL